MEKEEFIYLVEKIRKEAKVRGDMEVAVTALRILGTIEACEWAEKEYEENIEHLKMMAADQECDKSDFVPGVFFGISISIYRAAKGLLSFVLAGLAVELEEDFSVVVETLERHDMELGLLLNEIMGEDDIKHERRTNSLK